MAIAWNKLRERWRGLFAMLSINRERCSEDQVLCFCTKTVYGRAMYVGGIQ